MKTFIYNSFIIVFIGFFIQTINAQDPNWSVTPSNYQYSMTFTAFLNVNGTTLTLPADKVAAFVDGEVRGVAGVTHIASVDKYVAYLSVYANTAGETINFKIYDSSSDSSGSVFETDASETFIIDGIVGGVFQSYSIASPPLSGEAILNSFTFSGIASVSEEISSDKVTIVLPENTDVTSLTAVFDTSENSKVFIDRVLQESGVSAHDFTNPIVYQVLSENETTLVEYEVLVSTAVNQTPTTVVISTTENLNTNSIPVTLDIAFSKVVSGFQASDFVLENATILSFSTSDSQNYTVEIVPLSQGSFSAQIPAGVCLDSNNNQNESSNKIELTYDILKPLLSTVSVESDANSWWFLVTFSEDVVNVDVTDFELKGMASSGLTISAIEKISDDQYKINISNTNTDTGTVSLQLKSSNDIKDSADNSVVLSEFEAYFVVPKKVIWDGSDSTDWNTAANWDTNVIPTTSDDVFIPSGLANYPTTTSAVTVNAVAMESGTSLIAQSTFDVATNVTYMRNLPAQDKWYLVSSPVSGETIENLIATHIFATGTIPNIGLAPYDNTQLTNTTVWDYQTLASTGSINTGQGYAVRLATPGDISFTGTLNTDDVTQGITIGVGSAFNLIGNPYPSYINSGTFLSSNTSKLTNQTIWVWNQATDSYDTKVAMQNFVLAPTQGFFVQCAIADDVTFAKTNQSHEATDTFQRQTTLEIKLLVADETTNRYAQIYYLENATTGFDNGYDGELFGGVQNNFEIYTHLLSDNQNKKYQIQSLPNSDYESMVIPVGIKADADKEITFSAEALNLPTELKVFLEDKEANIFTRLDEANTEYTITLSEALDGVGRFYIHTSTSALSIDTVSLNTISIYKSDISTVRIAGLPHGNTSVKLFNIFGKEILNTTFEANGVKDISVSKLAVGIYIVKVQTELGTLNKKIILE